MIGGMRQIYPTTRRSHISQTANGVVDRGSVAAVSNLQRIGNTYDQAFIVDIHIDLISIRKAGVAKPVPLQSDVRGRSEDGNPRNMDTTHGNLGSRVDELCGIRRTDSRHNESIRR